jgi:GAF domain-containing protein
MAARWKWLLLALAGLVAAAAIATDVDMFGAGSTAWYGWWDALYAPSGKPFIVVITGTAAGGAATAAGLRPGDAIDLREQTLETRLKLAFQPLAGVPVPVVAHRGAGTIHANIVPTAAAQANFWPKASIWILFSFVKFFLACCVAIIAVRSAEKIEARLLSLVMATIAINTPAVAPSAAVTCALFLLNSLPGIAATALLIILASRFGRRSALRDAVEMSTYSILFLSVLQVTLFLYGIVTLRYDPLIFGVANFTQSFGLSSVLGALQAIGILSVTGFAVASAAPSERPRIGWLLLPLPLAMVSFVVFAAIVAASATSWMWYAACYVIAGACMLLGAMATTYALLRRRVLDFEFVVGRTVVVATVSVIVVMAFTLLEWLLGTVLAGLSRSAGIVANAALALALGLSLRHIHQRVDALVDATLFRKRHENERALLNFSKEAAFVTDAEALLDRTIEILRKHTDANSAVVYVENARAFGLARSFGDGAVSQIDENDGAILALKAWHKPIDPHRYDSSVRGALALPMVARGRLVGLLLVGERAGGEVYAADEVEALSQFAHGVGSAYDTLSASGGAVAGASLARMESLLERLNALFESRFSSGEAAAPE